MPVLDFPLRGQWLVINPPAHPRDAFDIIGIDARNLVRGGIGRVLQGELDVADTASWARPVFSPLAGEVVAARDGIPDRRAVRPVRDMIRVGLRGSWPFGSLEAMAGNHVIVRCAAGDVLLAHLRHGSVRVAVDERIDAGSPVGEVGNSGNSVTPHLHLQLSATYSRVPWPRVLPFRVAAFEQWRHGRWEQMRDAPLPRFARVRVEGA